MQKNGVTAHDADGNTLGSDSLKAEAIRIKEYFKIMRLMKKMNPTSQLS